MRGRAPFAAPAPFSRAPRERTFRRYLASFGIDAPPRAEADRKEADQALFDALHHIAKVKPRSSLVHVVAPAPEDPALPGLAEAARRVMRGGAAIFWSAPSFTPALSEPFDDPSAEAPDEEPPLLPRARGSAFAEVAPIAAEAVLARAVVARERREASLKRIGVRVVRVKHTAPARDSEVEEQPT
jgi:hypothetical protein